jgi:hypothetical protein
MCNNKEALKRKVHVLIDCATGVTADVADAYGQDQPFY